MFRLEDFYNLKTFFKASWAILAYFALTLLSLYFIKFDAFIATFITDCIFILGFLIYLILNKYVFKKTKQIEKIKVNENFLVFIFFMFLGFLISQALTSNLFIYEKESLNRDPITVNAYLYFLFVILVAPIGEEIIFRKLFMKRLSKRRYSFFVTLIVQALVFSLIHGAIYKIPATFTVGLIAGFLYYKYNIFTSMGYHILSNLFIAMYPKNITVDKLSKLPTIILLIAFILFIVYLIFYMKRWLEKK